MECARNRSERGFTMPKRNASKKPAFGGYAISFQGRTDSLESLFGATPIGPAEMTKKLWSYVKRKGLATKH
ncbi:MAG: hypothetical protein AUI47_09440 [Acidobacteria bacterium 13_1_40CM_2_68_5]|nr:MAG: hypothetical protein AUH69_09880 [Actinobacteria bacterium 13_1_40CM_4_65_12]OLD63329.1 MAG: hypothetical protein AUI47_09440 [Acidobacteria bacterium 13_1_40CM_2_68_5]